MEVLNQNIGYAERQVVTYGQTYLMFFGVVMIVILSCAFTKHIFDTMHKDSIINLGFISIIINFILLIVKTGFHDLHGKIRLIIIVECITCFSSTKELNSPPTQMLNMQKKPQKQQTSTRTTDDQ